MSAFMGMRGTGDWATNQDPESWAEYIMYEYPNGSAPLFAMQSMFRQETVNSHTHNWWTKTLPTRAGSASIYIDAGLQTAYVYASHAATNGVAGRVVYAKVTEAIAKEARPDHLAILRDSDQLTVDVRGRVADIHYDGANSWIAIKLIEDDDNHSDSSTYNLATVDYIMIFTSASPEGSMAPAPIGYDPVQYTNYVQEIRDTFELSTIAKASVLRTGPAYQESKRECAELHSMNIENAGFWGQKSITTGENGKRLFTTQGLIPFLQENNSANIVDFYNSSETAFAGKTWLQAGKKFLNTYLAQLFRYLRQDALGFVGDGALLAINELADTYSDISLTPMTTSYGLQVIQWITPFGTLNLKTHPLFSHETTHNRMMVILHPKNCKFAALVGNGENGKTTFEQDMQAPGQHSKLDGYTTTGMWKWYFPNQFMVMYNLGLDNITS